MELIETEVAGRAKGRSVREIEEDWIVVAGCAHGIVIVDSCAVNEELAVRMLGPAKHHGPTHQITSTP